MPEFCFSMRGLNQNLGKGFHTFVKFVGGAFWTHFVTVHLVVRLAIFLPFFLKFYYYLTLFSSIIIIIINIIHNSHMTYPLPICIMTHVHDGICHFHHIIISTPPLLIITSYHIILSQPCIVLYIHDLHSHYHISTISITIHQLTSLSSSPSFHNY